MVLCKTEWNYARNFRSGSIQSPKRGGFHLQAAFCNTSFYKRTSTWKASFTPVASHPNLQSSGRCKQLFLNGSPVMQKVVQFLTFLLHLWSPAFFFFVVFYLFKLPLCFHQHSCADWHRILFGKWENGWVRGSTHSFRSFIPMCGSRGKVKLQSAIIAEEQSAKKYCNWYRAKWRYGRVMLCFWKWERNFSNSYEVLTKCLMWIAFLRLAIFRSSEWFCSIIAVNLI